MEYFDRFSEYRLSELSEAGADIDTFLADAINPQELVEVIREAGLIAGLVLNSYKPTSSLFQKWRQMSLRSRWSFLN